MSPVSERSACKAEHISGEMLSQRYLRDSFALFRFVKVKGCLKSRMASGLLSRASPQWLGQPMGCLSMAVRPGRWCALSYVEPRTGN